VRSRAPSVDKCLSPTPACAGGSSRFLPSSGVACANRTKVRDHRDLSPYPRLGHRALASDAPSPSEHKAGWLDPGVTLDQTPLVDFCNQNNPRAQPRDRSILWIVPRTRRAQLALSWEESLRIGVTPSAISRCRFQATPSFRAPSNLAARRTPFRPTQAEFSRVRDRPALTARRLAPPTLVNESRWRSFAPARSARTPPVAEPREHRLELPMLNDAAQPKPDQVSPTIPPHQPCARE